MKKNDEDKKILKADESGDSKSIPNVKRKIAQYKGYASSALKKNKRINIRISQRDLTHIQRRAIEEGLPYQTLISSVLHKYISRSKS
ncbi:MAG: antitoxin [Elusimicrobiota bacterium]|nr:antitoxin [Elusimicrobiota bacterium]